MKLSLSSETRTKIFRGIGYWALSTVAFLLFVYWTFPWERLVRYGVAQAKTRADLDVDVQGFTPSFGTGFYVEQVTIKTAPTPTDKEGGEYVLQNVSARVSLLGLVWGTREITFSGEALGGSVEGVFVDSSNERSLDLSLQGLDLSKIKLLSNYAGLPITGRVNGEVDLSIPAKGVRSANGKIDLNITGGKVGAAGAKLDPSKYGSQKISGYDQSITLKEGADLGAFVCRINIQNGKGTVDEFAATGGEVEASFSGTLLLKDRMLTSVLSGVMKFRFDEDYVARNGMDLFLTSPRLAQAKTDDGYFAYNINDPLNRLSFKPSRRDSSKAGRPGTAGAGSLGTSDAPQIPRPSLAPALNAPAGVGELDDKSKEEPLPLGEIKEEEKPKEGELKEVEPREGEAKEGEAKEGETKEEKTVPMD